MKILSLATLMLLAGMVLASCANGPTDETTVESTKEHTTKTPQAVSCGD